MRLPARVGAKRAQHRRELAEVRERARARHFIARRGEVHVEQVLPGAAGDRPRFELGEVDASQREDAQRLEQRSRLVRQREHDAGFVGDCVADWMLPHHQESCDVVVEILYRRRERREAEDLARARRRDRRRVHQPSVGDHLGAAGGVVGGDDLDAGECPQESLALRKPLWMRVDALQAGQRRPRQCEQVMDDRQLDFRDNRQVVLEEQIVVAVDAPANRVLDRQHAIGGGAGLDAVKDLFETAAGDQVGIGIDPACRRLAERPQFALIRDLHDLLTPHRYTKKGHHRADDGLCRLVQSPHPLALWPPITATGTGTTCGDDRNLLDFIDATVDKQGRVLVGYADGCTGDCVGGNGPSRSAILNGCRFASPGAPFIIAAGWHQTSPQMKRRAECGICSMASAGALGSSSRPRSSVTNRKINR